MRPTWGHRRQGEEAWLDGRIEADNPYAEDTLAHIEWLAGHLSAAISSDELDGSCGLQIYLDETERWGKTRLYELRAGLPSAAEAAGAIGVPLDEWPGQCYGIAVELLSSGALDRFQAENGPLVAAYGLYSGPIAQASRFGGRPFSRHGWLESPDGHVVDPTRYVFSGTAPEIWIGSTDDYDLSGSRLRDGRPKPSAETGRRVSLPLNDPDSLAVFDRLLRSGRNVAKTGSISLEWLRWISNLPLERLGEDAPMVYRTVVSAGWPGLIPTDNRKWTDDIAAIRFTPSRPGNP